MAKYSLLPADTYTVVNKTILTENDKVNLINLYEPIIGPLPISLYLTLWSDLDRTLTLSIEYNHHHLMTFLKNSLEEIREAREALEAVGLIKTLFSTDTLKSAMYWSVCSCVPGEYLPAFTASSKPFSASTLNP